MPPQADRQGYEASIIDKHRLLDQSHSPKIVLIGGSNLAFGVDSERVHAATGLDVVNMGVNRFFGIRYCLEEVKESIRGGDIIVIVPEYENFYGDMYGSAHLMNVPVLYPRAIPWLLRSYGSSPLRIGDLGVHIYGVLAAKSDAWRRSTCESIVAALPNPTRLRGTGYWPNFDRAHFTKYGDFVGHLSQLPPKHKDLRLLVDAGNIDPESAAVLNSFNDFATKQGATVVLLPPPITQTAYETHRQQLDQLTKFWHDHLNLVMPAPLERYVFADGCFFNNTYHLFGSAREEHTQMMIDDLRSTMQTAANLKHPATTL